MAAASNSSGDQAKPGAKWKCNLVHIAYNRRSKQAEKVRGGKECRGRSMAPSDALVVNA
jgi:hypothetical protein